MADVDATIRAAVADSEGRTTRAISDLRTDLATWRQAFMPHERIEDHWRQDEATFSAHRRQLDEHEKLLSKIATKDDIALAVKEAVSGFVTEAQVKEIVSTHRGLAMSKIQQTIMWIVVLLGFLSSQGFIHPLALFTGGK